MNRAKRMIAVFDRLFSLGIVIASIALLIYMFVGNLFSIWLFFALLIFLYVGVRDLKQQRHRARRKHY